MLSTSKQPAKKQSESAKVRSCRAFVTMAVLVTTHEFCSALSEQQAVETTGQHRCLASCTQICSHLHLLQSQDDSGGDVTPAPSKKQKTGEDVHVWSAKPLEQDDAKRVRKDVAVACLLVSL